MDTMSTSDSVEWGNLVLGEVCAKIGSGATPRGGREAYSDDGAYALIRSQNVYNDGFHRAGLAFINDEQADALRNAEVFADDVLLNITGDSVARVCQVRARYTPSARKSTRPDNQTGMRQARRGVSTLLPSVPQDSGDAPIVGWIWRNQKSAYQRHG